MRKIEWAFLLGVVVAVGWIVPAFSAFDVKNQIVYGLPVAPGFVLHTLAYALAYCAAAVGAAVIALGSREFK